MMSVVMKRNLDSNYLKLALAGAAQWIEHWPEN